MESIASIDLSAITRTIVVGVAAYVGLVAFLRISGKRTLAKLNAFDLIVTVALGSTLSATLIQSSVSLAQGLVAFALLILLQFVVTFTSVRWKWFAGLLRSEPSLLLRGGELLERTMHSERITKSEVLSAIRSNGGTDVDDADLVVLETDGTISVVLK